MAKLIDTERGTLSVRAMEDGGLAIVQMDKADEVIIIPKVNVVDFVDAVQNEVFGRMTRHGKGKSGKSKNS